MVKEGIGVTSLFFASQSDMIIELQATMKSAQADDVNWFSSTKIHCN